MFVQKKKCNKKFFFSIKRRFLCVYFLRRIPFYLLKKELLDLLQKIKCLNKTKGLENKIQIRILVDICMWKKTVMFK